MKTTTPKTEPSPATQLRKVIFGGSLKKFSQFAKFALGALAMALAISAEVHASDVPLKPNIVILVADDLGYCDVSCYGSWIQTPNIDQLAREGMRFTDFHANGNVCTPTRCALVTGCYQQRAGLNGVLNPTSRSGLSQEEFTYADALKPAGYHTALYGKWHLGNDRPEYNPVNHGFDEFRGLLTGNIDYFTHFKDGKLDWWNGLKAQNEKGYSTTLIADHAVDFIQRMKAGPFCLEVAFNAVHTPIQDLQTGLPSKTADTYGKMTQAMDQGIGRILAALKENGLAENTFVFFFSDNGGHAGIAGSSNKPLRGFKGSFWEGGHREPAIAWWPGHIPAGQTTGQTAMGMDLMPTIMELAGATLPPGRKLDGVSLVALLLHDQPLASRKLFWGKGQSWAMRDGPWKLLREDDTTYLFNLMQDLSEQHDLAAQMPERVENMKADVEAWAKDVGAKVNTRETAPSKKRNRPAPDASDE